MGVKVIFLDDVGDRNLDYVTYVAKSANRAGEKGALMPISEGCKIFIKMDDVDTLISEMYNNDRYDLTYYGPVAWIDANGIWSDNKCERN